jgi:hypothetical protein
MQLTATIDSSRRITKSVLSRGWSGLYARCAAIAAEPGIRYFSCTIGNTLSAAMGSRDFARQDVLCLSTLG